MKKGKGGNEKELGSGSAGRKGKKGWSYAVGKGREAERKEEGMFR